MDNKYLLDLVAVWMDGRDGTDADYRRAASGLRTIGMYDTYDEAIEAARDIDMKGEYNLAWNTLVPEVDCEDLAGVDVVVSARDEDGSIHVIGNVRELRERHRVAIRELWEREGNGDGGFWSMSKSWAFDLAQDEPGDGLGLVVGDFDAREASRKVDLESRYLSYDEDDRPDVGLAVGIVSEIAVDGRIVRGSQSVSVERTLTWEHTPRIAAVGVGGALLDDPTIEKAVDEAVRDLLPGRGRATGDWAAARGAYTASDLETVWDYLGLRDGPASGLHVVWDKRMVDGSGAPAKSEELSFTCHWPWLGAEYVDEESSYLCVMTQLVRPTMRADELEDLEPAVARKFDSLEEAARWVDECDLGALMAELSQGGLVEAKDVFVGVFQEPHHIRYHDEAVLGQHHSGDALHWRTLERDRELRAAPGHDPYVRERKRDAEPRRGRSL